MKLITFLFSALGSLGFILSSCSSPVHETVKLQDSSRIQALLDLVDSSTNFNTWTGQDWINYDRRLYELQKRADIVFESVNWKDVKVLSSKADVKLPKEEFPISDLIKYFPTSKNRQVGELGIIIFQNDFILQTGQPTDKDVMNNIDTVLQGSGIRRVMFQSHWHGLLVQISPRSN